MRREKTLALPALGRQVGGGCGIERRDKKSFSDMWMAGFRMEIGFDNAQLLR
jgi:hypothetical protein